MAQDITVPVADGFVHEDFFLGDSADKLGRPIYEIGFYFYMKTPAAFEPVCRSLATTALRKDWNGCRLTHRGVCFRPFFARNWRIRSRISAIC